MKSGEDRKQKTQETQTQRNGVSVGKEDKRISNDFLINSLHVQTRFPQPACSYSSLLDADALSLSHQHLASDGGLTFVHYLWPCNLEMAMFKLNLSVFSGASDVKAIHKLPVEIIQCILDYVVVDILDLFIRHVCRGFRDCFLQAMASIISAHTTFDLRSVDSMTNLRAIAEYTELAKHITSLKVTSCYVPDSVPGTFSKIPRQLHTHGTSTKGDMTESEYLSVGALQHLDIQRKKDRGWDPTKSIAYFRDLQSNPDNGIPSADPIVLIIADCLRKFPKLQRAAYTATPFKCQRSGSARFHMSAQYTPIFAKLRSPIKHRILDYAITGIDWNAKSDIEEIMGWIASCTPYCMPTENPPSLTSLSKKRDMGLATPSCRRGL